MSACLDLIRPFNDTLLMDLARLFFFELPNFGTELPLLCECVLRRFSRPAEVVESNRRPSFLRLPATTGSEPVLDRRSVSVMLR